MVIVELCCDHPDCIRLRRVIKQASDVVQAKKMIVTGQVRCPLHGTRTDPIVIGRTDSGQPDPPGGT